MIRLRKKIYFAVLGMALLSFACAGDEKYRIKLLPTPEAYSRGLVNPFTDYNPAEKDLPYHGILYATDRLPANEDDEERFYTSKPSGVIRLGLGHLEVNDKKISWKEALRISLLKNRNQEYPLSIGSIEEFGLLSRTYSIFLDPDLAPKTFPSPGSKFADIINQKLAVSPQKNIFLYVHGYNTNFDDPLLVASELWHYLGYDGVFIAFAWPSTPSGTAYLGDTEKAKLASRNLRLFLEYLSEETDAENIHLLGYSMGTRVTTWALEDITLIHYRQPREAIRKNVRIGNVILCGSDLSLYSFGNFLQDGLLNVVDSFTIYSSDSDMALGASHWLFDRIRLGQITQKENLGPQTINFLKNNKKLRVIDVTGAEDSAEGNGHHYLLNSPWVSSDILMTFMYDRSPENRGLTQKEDVPIWYFSKDYIERMREALNKVNPGIQAGENNPIQ